MSEGRGREDLPIRSLHDFLVEISNEWDRFRNGSLLSIGITIILFILFIPRFFILTLRRSGPLDSILALGIIATLLYSTYLSYRQYQFYKRWEKRMGLILHIEKELMGEDEE